MAGDARRRRAFERHRGFALLIVLWTLVLIAFIVGHVATAGRTELRIAGNLAANAASQAAADGAIYQAIFGLSDPLPEQRWLPDGSVRQLQIGNSVITLQIHDEAGRINPSLAAPALTEALLRTLGADAGSAHQLTARIGEWVGQQTTRSAAQILAEYQAAGLDYGPPGQPLQSLDELSRVRGMTPALIEAMRPHLTLYGPANPNPAAADQVVLAALAMSRGGNLQPGAPPPPGQQPGAANNDVVVARIEAAAQGPGNARTTRVAIARIGASLVRGYVLLAWDRAID